MEMSEFKEAERIVLEIRELDRAHESYQKVISGDSEILGIESEAGRFTIHEEKISKPLAAHIDSWFFDERERLLGKLKEI